MRLFGHSIDFSGLHVPNGCSVSDGVLAQNPGGVRVNLQMTLGQIETRSGNLLVGGGIFQPEPFDDNKTQAFSLVINPRGKWLDSEGNPLTERKLTITPSSVSEAPHARLGNDQFSINAYLTGTTLALNGPDNIGEEGSVEYQVETYWPEKGLVGAADSVRIPTNGLFQFNATNVSRSWSFSQETSVDTVITVLDNDLYMHAATFSMADTAVFQIHFNCLMKLPLPDDIVDGQVELTDNRLGTGLFEFGKLHTAKVSVAGINLELLDFHFARNEMIDFSEIEFTQTRVSVQPKEIMADLYLSFGATLSMDIPGFGAGIDRFVIFKNEDQFHLLIKHAMLWIGEKFTFDLDLIGSIWQGGDKTLFRWLIGGHLDVELGDFKGGAVVGEVSFKETVGVDNQVYQMPGFGLFVSANVDVDLKPIPVKLKGFGAGFFFNPSPEIQIMVRHHLGFDDEDNTEIREEFKTIMDSMQDDIMTFWEIYLYGAAAIPDDKMLNGKALLTIATDRLRLDAKVWPADSTAMKKIIDLSGWLMAECAWKQDFSAFKYFAGHIKVGGRPAVDEEFILKLPETAKTQLDFIVTGEGQFAIGGNIQATVLNNLKTEFDFTFGNPGFVFNGSLGYGFDIASILTVEAGMDLMVYLQWLDPVKFGAYASMWVQGYVLSEWLAGFRGEMGAALMAEPDFFLYGYAELTGTVLGVSKTIRAWAKWEQGGGMSAGTGADPTLAEIIAEAQQTAEDIMTAVEELKAEMGILEPGGFSDEELRTLIQRMHGALAEDYYILWKSDVDEIKAVYNKIRGDIQGDDGRRLDLFVSALSESGTLHPTVWMNDMTSLENEVAAMDPVLDQVRSDLQARYEAFQDGCDQLSAELNAIDFGLDTLLSAIDVGGSPIQNPLALSYGDLEGVRTPVITVDATLTGLNKENAEKLQQVFAGWLASVEQNIQKIRNGRKGIYRNIGPDGTSSQVHARIQEPILTGNGDFQNTIVDLNGKFKKLYDRYNGIPLVGVTDAAMTLLANDKEHRESAIAGRGMALAMLGISWEDLPSNEIDRYRVLGNRFFRVVPQVMMQNSLEQADSLIFYFQKYFKDVQSALDRQHQIFTSHTDGLWDKYAELSEKLYAILDLYRSYAKGPMGGDQTFALKDSADAILSGLEKEFTFPAVTPSLTVSQTQGFEPVAVTLDCQTNPPEGISEYAASFNDHAPQSFGAESRVVREEMLKHGVSYWYETSAGERTIPFVDTETRSLKIAPRLRNLAGLTTTALPGTAELHGKNWYYGNPSNQIAEQKIPDSSVNRCLVFWPYRIVREHYSTNPDNSMTHHPAYYFCGQAHALTVQWTLENNYGISLYTPVPAKHVIEIKQGGKTVFGPRTFPVTQTALPDTFQVQTDGLNLTPDTGEPVYAHVTAYDVSDRAIGTSTGSWTVYYKGENDATGSLTETWEPPPLYIDTTPPVFEGDAEHIRIGDESAVIVRLPKAKDDVKIAGGGTWSEWISDPSAYEYQLLSPDEDPGPSGWLNLDGSSLVTSLPLTTEYDQNIHTLTDPGSGAYFLNFAPMSFAGPLKFAVRARNNQPLWNTGYSASAFFAVPKADESESPRPATFKILGLDAGRDLEIQILQAGADSLSGVSHYPWRLIQNLYRSKNPIVTVWDPESLKFPADTVQAGAVLSIPIPHDSIDVDNAFDVELYTIDRCGNLDYTQQSFLPGPQAPDLTARLLEGMKPFTLEVSGTLAPLADHYIDSLVCRIGTAPDASDILVARKSISEIYRLQNGDTFTWSIDLPETVDEGTSLFLSAVTLRGGQASPSFTQRIQIYRPMFQAVETDEDGYLALPIVQSAFNGQKEAAAFKWAVGYLAPSLSGQSRYQLNIQPLTTLDGVTGEQVSSGARIRLPIKAGDVRPVSLVVLQATALDGEICATYLEAHIVPPKPELKAVLALITGEKDRFFYRVRLETKFGTLLQSFSAGNPEVLLKIGSVEGTADLKNLAIPLVSYLQDGFTPKEVFLDEPVSQLERIHLTAFSRIDGNRTSRDSTTLVLDVPQPPFWKNPKIDFSGNLAVVPLRPGYRDANQIAGYQFAVGDGAGSIFDLRPYPSDIASLDIPSSAWHAGEELILPFAVQGLMNKTYRVGVRVVLQDGGTHEQVLITNPFLQPVVDAFIIEAFPQNRLRVKGDLGPEMVTQISMKELRIELTLNGDSKFYRTFTVPDNGVLDVKYDLPDMPPCETYQFKSYFWHTQSQQFAMYVTELDMPCEPMFFKADADSQDMIGMDIIRPAFDGNRVFQGYQFALGSKSGASDTRPFPAEGQYDFAPDAVRAGSRLTLPHSLIGVPSTCFVTLRGIDPQGKIHRTIQSFQTRPPRQEVSSLVMDRNGRFAVQFDQNRIDGKVLSVDFWIQSTEQSDVVIAYAGGVPVADLKAGIVYFDSQFTEADLGKSFMLEGLSIGYQINSLNFQYRFRIEKEGDGYRVIPEP
ncbi:hypothetical protein JW906_09470 [bacterium]|nr:hypothetical protein [bacterium]